jgi:phage shock protein A
LAKPKPPQHWERQVAKYERKIAQATTPTQRAYAIQMKRVAQKNLDASRGGVDRVDTDQDGDTITLDPEDYREL